jgi:hypothetical protein
MGRSAARQQALQILNGGGIRRSAQTCSGWVLRCAACRPDAPVSARGIPRDGAGQLRASKR